MDEERHFGIQPDAFIVPLTCSDLVKHNMPLDLPCIEDGVAAFDPQNQDDLRSMVSCCHDIAGIWVAFFSSCGQVLRDRNHPSIFAWSLCNEPECETTNSSTALAAGTLYKKIIHELVRVGATLRNAYE